MPEMDPVSQRATMAMCDAFNDFNSAYAFLVAAAFILGRAGAMAAISGGNTPPHRTVIREFSKAYRHAYAAEMKRHAQ